VSVLDLTRSRTRAALLGLLFADPQREWHVRGLAGELGVSAGNVHRELTRLAAAGYVVSRRQANLVLYRLDQGHPLYPELRGLVSKTVGAEALLGAALGGVAGVELAFMFGSLAASSERARSDVDLMVIGTPAARELHRALRPVEDELRRDVHYFVFGADELVRRVRDGDGFIADVLGSRRAWILGDEARLQARLAGAPGSQGA
jgi:DNA-binding transcriptional ArsR family regulator